MIMGNGQINSKRGGTKWWESIKDKGFKKGI